MGICYGGGRPVVLQNIQIFFIKWLEVETSGFLGAKIGVIACQDIFEGELIIVCLGRVVYWIDYC